MAIIWYIKKPIPIQGVQWTGDNAEELIQFTKHHFRVIKPQDSYRYPDGVTALVYDVLHKNWTHVMTNQTILMGVQGEFYPISEEILAITYDPTEDPKNATPEEKV